MPKKDIDYSNTIIYKITCDDKNVKDLYVGHTTNFVQRKHFHKQNCNNEASQHYSSKLYKTIRANGGWVNWNMEVIAMYNCCDHYDARKRENESINSLGANLSSVMPMPKQKSIKHDDNMCDKTSQEKITNSDTTNTFICDICDYKCSLKQHLKQHFMSKRHKNRLINNVENSVNNVENSVNAVESQTVIKKFVCACGVSYQERSGLWRHKQVCKHKAVVEDPTCISTITPKPNEFASLITDLVKSHHDLQDSILEICKNGIHNTINTTTMMNSNNKTFNLNMFLNETCKDAMNITEFVDSIKLQLSDLENVGELGYVKGISNIIVKNLNALDITRRPLHCADKKREVLYIKDDDKWERESDENEKLRKMIKRVAFKNYKQITQFKAKHPDCNKSDSKYSDKYNKIIIESMGGEGDKEKENEDKIIRNISREVVIDKVNF